MSTPVHTKRVVPAFDCITHNCRTPGCPGYPSGDGRSHGIGSERVVYVARTEHHTGPVAVSFDYATGKYHETTARWRWSKPMAFDIGHHASVASYDGEWRSESCDWLDGAPCYYDGSGLQADRYLAILNEHGEDALWAALDERLAEFVADLDAHIRERGGVVR